MSKGNEPAYPHTFTIPSSGGDATIISHGLTKRDLIAAMTMQGMLAHPVRYKPREIDNDLYWHQAIANEAVELSDALLEAINGKT